MDLVTLCFILMVVLFTIFFFLGGLDYGVGLWLLILSADDTERRVMLNTVGPFWGSNGVWMISALLVLFAAFPQWFASISGAFYVPMVVLLLALVFRGVAFEFRSQESGQAWRRFWDIAFAAGSLAATFFWGVFLANVSSGLPLNEDWLVVAPFWRMLHPLALVGGLAMVALFAFHALLFLNLRTHGELQVRIERGIRKAWWPAFLSTNGFVVWALARSGIFAPLTVAGAILALILISFLFVLCRHFLDEEQPAGTLMTSGLVIVLTTLVTFAPLYLNGLVSTLDPVWSIPIQTAASNAYSLSVLAIAVAIGLPLFLFYQIWAYRILRDRIGVQDTLEY